MRTFEETHPWLKDFSVDLRKIDYITWLLLGEAASKIEHIAGVPLSPEAAEELHQVLIMKGALATTAIEGNTLTEEEVIKHLKGTLKLPPSRQYLAQEIDNIVDACNGIKNRIIQEGNVFITTEEIINYNKLVLRNLPLDEDTIPGEIRSHSVVVGRYRCAPAEDCKYLLDNFCEWLNNLDFPKNQEIESSIAIVTAIAAHLYFVWIHPFGDGNGRTARLIEFRYLLQAGFPTPTAHLLSNFYNLTRTEYYRQLDKASRQSGDKYKFIVYAIQGLVDQLREQLIVIRNYQWDNTWENYVYKQRLGQGNKVQGRRRRVIMALSNITENNGWIRASKIPDLTSQLARDYANKTHKTLSRDINSLEELNLLIRSDNQVKANKELILAFLPERAMTDSPKSDKSLNK